MPARRRSLLTVSVGLAAFGLASLPAPAATVAVQDGVLSVTDPAGRDDELTCGAPPGGRCSASATTWR